MNASLITRVLQSPLVLISSVVALVTLYGILRFPELGVIIAQYNQF